MLFLRSALTVVAALSVANAANLKVTVGADDDIIFDPTFLLATVGDTVTFTWASSGHSVTQGPFPDDCSTLSGGFNSGVQKSKFVYNINITSVGTIAVHCIPHCTSGMQMTINGTAPKAEPETPEEPEEPPYYTIGSKFKSCVSDPILKVIGLAKWF